VFLLCKTSNAGSGDLQDVMVDSGQWTVDSGRPIPLYVHVAHLAQSWNTRNNIGLVVGATHLDAMQRVREAAPNLWFLAPGVGAQGGELESALRAGLRQDGKGLLLPISRAISRSDNPRKTVLELRDAMLGIRSSGIGNK
jgi:uridine monophosphate synthetase